MKIVRPLAVGDTGTFTRASVARYWDKNAQLQVAAVDVPRISYDPTGAKNAPAFMFEKAAENRCFHNGSLAANWTVGSWVDNVSSAPDGTTTTTLVSNTAGGHSTSVPNAGMYTYSLYVKPAVTPRVTLHVSGQSNSIASKSVEFNTSTGSITMSHPNDTTAKMVALKNGFWRVEMTIFIQQFCTLQIWAGSLNGHTIHVWRPQLEAGEEATSVIFTTGSFATRAADVNTCAMLSLLPEDDAPAWDANKAYQVGEKCTITTNGVHKVFVSAVGKSSPVSFVDATTDYAVWEGHGFLPNQPLRFTSTGNLPTGLSANSTYYYSSNLATAIPESVPLRVSVNGAIISNLTGSTGVVTCYTADNLNKPPLDNPSLWIDAGSTNKYAMFDGSADSQTFGTDHITSVLKVPNNTYVNTLVVQNIANARYARVVMTDAIEGVVYDKEISLVSSSGIQDWRAFFFEPIVYLTEFILSDLPPYAGCTISISFFNSGKIVKCGLCLLGNSRTLGYTQAGMQIGILDYSTKETDDFGNTTVLERPYSRTMNATVWVDKEQRGAVLALLNSYRATPIIYIGDQNDPTTVLFGYFRDYSDGIDMPTVSVLNIEIESLK